MFRCEKCGTVTQPGQAMVMVVTEIRKVTHPLRMNARKEVIDRGGEGTQIVREQRTCGC